MVDFLFRLKHGASVLFMTCTMYSIKVHGKGRNIEVCIVDFLLLFLIPYIFLIASVGFVSNNWIATLKFYETFNIFPASTVAMKCRLCKKLYVLCATFMKIYLLWVYNASDSKCNWKKREGGKQKSFLKIIISKYIHAWINSRNDYIWFTYDDILFLFQHILS